MYSLVSGASNVNVDALGQFVIMSSVQFLFDDLFLWFVLRGALVAFVYYMQILLQCLFFTVFNTLRAKLSISLCLNNDNKDIQLNPIQSFVSFDLNVTTRLEYR